MIHRLTRGQIPKKPHTVFEVDGSLTFEHCITRAGFESIYTVAWQRKPPHWVGSEEDLGPHSGWAEPSWEGPLRRCHYLTTELPAGGTPFLGRKLMVANPDLGLWMAQPVESEPTLVANADGDELTFVHAGSGRVECPLGVIPFTAHDYVYVPQGLPHRWILDGPAHLMMMEARSPLRVPKQYRCPEGQLSMYAPYTHHDFVEPRWPEGGPESLGAPRRLIVQSGGRLTAFELANDPFDVVGWDGQMWPFAFPILAFQPKTSSVHLPPTIHTTFAGEGYVVCSFVPTSGRTRSRVPIPIRRRTAMRSSSTSRETSHRARESDQGRSRFIHVGCRTGRTLEPTRLPSARPGRTSWRSWSTPSNHWCRPETPLSSRTATTTPGGCGRRPTSTRWEGMPGTHNCSRRTIVDPGTRSAFSERGSFDQVFSGDRQTTNRFRNLNHPGSTGSCRNRDRCRRVRA